MRMDNLSRMEIDMLSVAFDNIPLRNKTVDLIISIKKKLESATATSALELTDEEAELLKTAFENTAYRATLVDTWKCIYLRFNGEKNADNHPQANQQ